MAIDLKKLGRYRIDRVLGKGAMGVVYEGFDPNLGRHVAIKTILKSHMDERTAKDYSARFRREAQAVGKLNHPNVVQVHDFGEEGDMAYLVMEFIKGKELKTYFDDNERFDLKTAVRIMSELCEALEFAHKAGIIHRDVKPGNVMLDAEQRVKLTDFGVARIQDATGTHMTQAGSMVGTPAYMSPEQIAGRPVDARSDVFSAGIILYQFLTGEMPFTGAGAWTVAKKIMQDEPTMPSTLDRALSPVWDEIVSKALAKDVAKRYQSARALSQALKHGLEGGPKEDDADKTIAIIPKKGTIPQAARPGQQEAELEFWRSIKDGNDPEDFELYIQQFPSGIYAALAKRKIAKLRGGPDVTQAPTVSGTQTIVQTPTNPPVPAPAAAAAYTQTIALTPPPTKTEPHSTVPPTGIAPAHDVPPPPMERSSMPMMLVVGVAVAVLGAVGWFAWKPTPEAPKAQASAQGTKLVEAPKREEEKAIAQAPVEQHAAPAKPPAKETAAEKAAREKAEATRMAAAKAQAEKEAAAAALALKKAELAKLEEEKALTARKSADAKAADEKRAAAAAALALAEKHAAEAAERDRVAQAAAEKEAADRAAAESAERARLAKLEEEKAAATRPGRVFRDCQGCPEMVILPLGSYNMGSPATEAGRAPTEGPQHRVAITQQIAVGKFEVTFDEWAMCVREGGCKENPGDTGWGKGKRPVINVSWNDAKQYVKWLAEKTGKGYRLLSEAEWEFAARAGNGGPFSFGNAIAPEQANYDAAFAYAGGATGTKLGKTATVGSYKPNAFGLYDMHGNVAEWTEDCLNDTYVSAPNDGSAWEVGNCGQRLVRGGSWESNPSAVRSASRAYFIPFVRMNSVGLRIARPL
ncbi:MAG: SUMF1/EgtB/PvdO family nonheme iron enzyme [Betaproteobacteria bacterium]|nr:SUMF1/EgtB/PvdO family nonheme iron enzyme [Betaproteobacteria bacterium]MBV9361301.1 SUMF1/EgtB/PvdO family nonheme iron enzyme [Betaproteobacteria bacterium]